MEKLKSLSSLPDRLCFLREITEMMYGNRSALIRSCSGVLFCLALGTASLAAQERLRLDWPELARVIIQRMALEQGETVLLVAHPEMFRDLIPPLRYEVMKAGAVDLGVIDVLPSGEWDSNVIQQGAGPSREVYQEIFKDIDASVMLPGATPKHPAYAAIQDILRAGKSRTVHFHWLENRSAYPLSGQPLPDPSAIDAFYQLAVLNSDYDALTQIQGRFEQAMRKREIRVTTPLGTDLRFRIGDRPVNRQDGDASKARTDHGVILIDREIEIPAGAVRVAPLEETVRGTIAFPPSQWNGGPVTGLKLEFVEGRVLKITAESGKEHVEAEMEQAGDVGRRFREFALGFNPQLTVPERNSWIPYYGYGSGVVRLSLGDNSELGGTVRGERPYIRWNFFTDATVRVGNEVWVRDGKLVK